MIRTIVHFDEEKCNGCGLCANACQEGAIGIVNGKGSFCATITATVSATACLHVPRTQSPLWSAKRRRLTRKP